MTQKIIFLVSFTQNLIDSRAVGQRCFRDTDVPIHRQLTKEFNNIFEVQSQSFRGLGLWYTGNFKSADILLVRVDSILILKYESPLNSLDYKL